MKYKNLVEQPILNRDGTKFKTDRKGNVKTKLVLKDSEYEMSASDLAWYKALSVTRTAVIVGALGGLVAGVLTSIHH